MQTQVANKYIFEVLSWGQKRLRYAPEWQQKPRALAGIKSAVCAPSEGSRAAHLRTHTFLNYECSEGTFVCFLFVPSTYTLISLNELELHEEREIQSRDEKPPENLQGFYGRKPWNPLDNALRIRPFILCACRHYLWTQTIVWGRSEAGWQQVDGGNGGGGENLRTIIIFWRRRRPFWFRVFCPAAGTGNDDIEATSFPGFFKNLWFLAFAVAGGKLIIIIVIK